MWESMDLVKEFHFKDHLKVIRGYDGEVELSTPCPERYIGTKATHSPFHEVNSATKTCVMASKGGSGLGADLCFFMRLTLGKI